MTTPNKPPQQLVIPEVKPKLYATTADELAPYYVTAQEARCHDDKDKSKPCSFCGGKIYISFELLKRFKLLREAFGKAIKWSSGYRCKAKQKHLYDTATPEERAKGLVAKPGYSPHEFGDAADLKKPAEFASARAWGEYINRILKGDIRIGCKAYSSFAHIDVRFLSNRNLGKGVRW